MVGGTFLAWAKHQGATVAGTEIDARMIAHACSKGFEAHPAPLDALTATQCRFDLIVAFDVFEHWSKDELIASIWRHTAVTDNALVQCITEIRRALGDDSHQPRFIRTRI